MHSCHLYMCPSFHRSENYSLYINIEKYMIWKYQMAEKSLILYFWQCEILLRDHHGHDRMVIGLMTTYAICAYHHWSCEFETHSILDTTLCNIVCQWLGTGWWFSLVSSTNKTDCHDITEILLKEGLQHHNPNPELSQCCKDIHYKISILTPNTIYSWLGL